MYLQRWIADAYSHVRVYRTINSVWSSIKKETSDALHGCAWEVNEMAPVGVSAAV